MISKKCKQHLKDVDMNAAQHGIRALKIAVTFQLLVFTSIIHAFAPRFFITTSTDHMKRLLDIKAAEEAKQKR